MAAEEERDKKVWEEIYALIPTDIINHWDRFYGEEAIEICRLLAATSMRWQMDPCWNDEVDAAWDRLFEFLKIAPENWITCRSLEDSKEATDAS